MNICLHSTNVGNAITMNLETELRRKLFFYPPVLKWTQTGFSLQRKTFNQICSLGSFLGV